MRILIDVMSGDNAPLELLRGAVLAAAEYPQISIAVVGTEDLIYEIAEANDIDLEGIEIIPSTSVIEMEDKALSVVRDKKDSSMSVGLHALAAGEGDAFVSAGNTGALLAGATLLVRRIRGIRRAGIASILPFPNPVLLMDCGANLEVTPENIEQFAYMGSLYMKRLYGLSEPRVGLLNNGTEYNKGLPLQVASYERLSHSELNFVGNVEGKTLPFNSCDVAVTDGFTGNLVLKVIEGMGKFFGSLLKDFFHSSLTTKISGLMVQNRLSAVKKNLDASEHGGAPLLGIAKPVIKAHGSSDANAIKNAVHQAMTFVSTEINYDIAEWAAEFEKREQEAEFAEAREERQEAAEVTQDENK
ncbi:MAG: phosphate acyltransferase PlsX [Clostridia bacterium]|nr:phosphate acyltransferase PlsX [Clostridia bacterium]